MSWRELLYQRAGGFRALWRVLFFSIFSVACWLVLALTIQPLLAALLGHADFGDKHLTSGAIVQAAALVAATAIMVRVIDRARWADVWLDASAARPPLLALGFGVGAVAIALAIGALMALRLVSLQSAAAGGWLASSGRVSLFLLPAALNEELLIRGYLMAVLQQAFGWRGAIIITSVIFGALHLLNPGADVQSLALVTLAGGFLGLVLWVTRSLYATWLAHFAWNCIMAVGFHAPVSGLPLETSGYRYVDAGPAWVTGGIWGPEGGVMAGVSMLAIGALLAFGSRQPAAGRRQHQEPTR